MPSSTSEQKERRYTQIVVALCVLLSGAVFVMLQLHLGFLNGPSYWKWPWRRLSVVRVFSCMFIGLVLFLGAHFAVKRAGWSHGRAILLIMLSAFVMQIMACGVQSDPFNLEAVWKSVASPIITSYFTDAAMQIDNSCLLAQYHQLLPDMNLHSMTKPPLPVLYYSVMLKLFGINHGAALVGGLIIAMLATFTVPATYLLVVRLTGNRDAALHAGSFIALTPSLIIFMPEFDQIYPVITCLLIAGWAGTLRTDRAVYSSAWGILLAVALFTSYSFVVLGLFLAAYSGCALLKKEISVRFALTHVLIAGMSFTAFYTVLWLCWGFRPLATFSAALDNASLLHARWKRPYPQTIGYDILDFALGAAWIPYLLAAAAFIRRRVFARKTDWIVLICLAQILVVAGSGLLPCETARVWTFMLPLLMLPAGLELSKMSFASQMAVYVCGWLLLSGVLQNMLMLYG